MRHYNPIDVLVVEDNPDDSELTMHAVKRGNRNAHIIHMWNGDDAMDFLRSRISLGIGRLRLIVLNLSLPKIDGFELLAKIRATNLTKTTPIVILTATEEESKITEAYRLGANSYVIKPTRFEDYVDKVSSITHYWSTINEWSDWSKNNPAATIQTK
jgi:two-component system, response regulator